MIIGDFFRSLKAELLGVAIDKQTLTEDGTCQREHDGMPARDDRKTAPHERRSSRIYS
jgi:hypothetical protein